MSSHAVRATAIASIATPPATPPAIALTLGPELFACPVAAPAPTCAADVEEAPAFDDVLACPVAAAAPTCAPDVEESCAFDDVDFVDSEAPSVSVLDESDGPVEGLGEELDEAGVEAGPGVGPLLGWKVLGLWLAGL